MRSMDDDDFKRVLEELEHANTCLQELRPSADTDREAQRLAQSVSDHLNRAIGRLEFFAEIRP